MFALPTLKSFQEIYRLPKKGELGLLSAQPDSRSATTIWLGLSGLAVVNVSDWVTLGKLSAPVIRSTSVLPNARGDNSFWASLENALPCEALPPSDRPQKIIMAPARKFSCLSMPSCLMREQSIAAGTSGSMELEATPYFCCISASCAADRLFFCPNGLAARSASEMPVIPTNSPIKTRRLKNADREVDFFFMCGYGLDELSLNLEVSLLPKAPANCQYFFQKNPESFRFSRVKTR